MAVVHLLSDLDPVRHRLSEYVNGPVGSLMTAAFLTLGFGLIAIGLAIAGTHAGERRALAVGGTLSAAGLALIVAGLAPTDPGAATTVETVHSRASGVATLAIIGAAIAWSWRRAPGDRGLRWLAALAAGLGMLSVILHDTTTAGLGQRLLWAVLIAWLLLAARRLGPSDGDGGPVDGALRSCSDRQRARRVGPAKRPVP